MLIAGGRDKGGSYAPMVEALRDNGAARVVLIGEAADKIAAADRRGAVADACARRSMDEAVDARRELARSRATRWCCRRPARSYDMFENYEHRGRVFRAAVEAL